MTTFILTRPTIYQVPSDLTLAEYKSRIPDAARRRHLCFGGDFDTRATVLSTKIESHWEPKIQAQWQENQGKVKQGLIDQFGEQGIDVKVRNFLALDSKPMSILAYHNTFFEQVRNSFVMGHYYPALVGACALAGC